MDTGSVVQSTASPAPESSRSLQSRYPQSRKALLAYCGEMEWGSVMGAWSRTRVGLEPRPFPPAAPFQPATGTSTLEGSSMTSALGSFCSFSHSLCKTSPEAAVTLDVTHCCIDKIVGCGRRWWMQIPQPGCQEEDEPFSEDVHRINLCLFRWAHPRRNPYGEQNVRMVCMPMIMPRGWMQTLGTTFEHILLQ